MTPGGWVSNNGCGMTYGHCLSIVVLDMYMYVLSLRVHVLIIIMIFIVRGVETLSQLPDILTYFHHSCPAPHILSIQLSFNLPDIF